MHRIGRRLLALAWLLAGIAGARAAAAPPVGADSLAAVAPRWPLDLPTRYLTSNFMEYREGRFHAGIDLKTGGQTGWAVRAAEDGSLILLRALPEGYGRAILLEGRSGRRYLYAHLARFADRPRAVVTAAQRAAGRYRVEVELPPGALAVSRGEVLALSGQSGTVGPHLHLEVRNAAGWALDPLRHGFAVRDTIPPRLLRVTALPAAPDARVEGGLTACSVADTAGLPAELPALRIAGAVAFAAEWEERSDRMGHRLAPRVRRARLDGVELFTAVNDSFPFARQAEARLEWLETADWRAQWLGRRPQDDLPGRAGGDWSLADGRLTPGRHRVEIIAED
ncbi:MAG: M23 family metallopeptidase, partial [Candidatus Krumholzibacteriia bacterium]